MQNRAHTPGGSRRGFVAKKRAATPGCRGSCLPPLPDGKKGSTDSQRRRENAVSALALRMLAQSKPVPTTLSGTISNMSKLSVENPRLQKVLSYLRYATTDVKSTSLDLSECGLMTHDYVALGELLLHHPSINSVDLTGNVIDIPSGKALCSVLRQNPMIVSVDYDVVSTDPDIAVEMEDVLERNRRIVTKKQRKEWIAEEKRLYEESVKQFCKFLEELFFAEMRLRRELEELQEDVREELKLRAAKSKKQRQAKQRARQVAELIAEHAVLVEEREHLFRQTLIAEYATESQELTSALEGDARQLIMAEEVEVRQHRKKFEVQRWVLTRRAEKARWARESVQRGALEDEETKVRTRILQASLVFYFQETPKEEESRAEAQFNEDIRVERERREAQQKRRAEELARERKEREEAQRNALIARFKMEQRREREKLDAEQAFIRKRAATDRAALMRQLESAWSIEHPYLIALSDRNDAHRRLTTAVEMLVENDTNAIPVRCCFYGTWAPVDLIPTVEYSSTLVSNWMLMVQHAEPPLGRAEDQLIVAYRTFSQEVTAFKNMAIDSCSEEMFRTITAIRASLIASFEKLVARPPPKKHIPLPLEEAKREKERLRGGTIVVEVVDENDTPLPIPSHKQNEATAAVPEEIFCGEEEGEGEQEEAPITLAEVQNKGSDDGVPPQEEEPQTDEEQIAPKEEEEESEEPPKEADGEALEPPMLTVVEPSGAMPPEGSSEFPSEEDPSGSAAASEAEPPEKSPTETPQEPTEEAKQEQAGDGKDGEQDCTDDDEQEDEIVSLDNFFASSPWPINPKDCLVKPRPPLDFSRQVRVVLPGDKAKKEALRKKMEAAMVDEEAAPAESCPPVVFTGDELQTGVHRLSIEIPDDPLVTAETITAVLRTLKYRYCGDASMQNMNNPLKKFIRITVTVQVPKKILAEPKNGVVTCVETVPLVVVIRPTVIVTKPFLWIPTNYRRADYEEGTPQELFRLFAQLRCADPLYLSLQPPASTPPPHTASTASLVSLTGSAPAVDKEATGLTRVHCVDEPIEVLPHGFQGGSLTFMLRGNTSLHDYLAFTQTPDLCQLYNRPEDGKDEIQFYLTVPVKPVSPVNKKKQQHLDAGSAEELDSMMASTSSSTPSPSPSSVSSPNSHQEKREEQKWVTIAVVDKGTLIPVGTVPPLSQEFEHQIELSIVSEHCTASLLRRLMSRIRFSTALRDPEVGAREVVATVMDSHGNYSSTSVVVSVLPSEEPVELSFPINRLSLRRSESLTEEFARCAERPFLYIGREAVLDASATERFAGGHLRVALTSKKIDGDFLVLVCPKATSRTQNTQRIAIFARREIVYRGRVVGKLTRGASLPSGSKLVYTTEMKETDPYTIHIDFPEDGSTSMGAVMDIVKSIVFSSFYNVSDISDRSISVELQIGTAVKLGIEGEPEKFMIQRSQWCDPTNCELTVVLSPPTIISPSFPYLEHIEGGPSIRCNVFEVREDTLYGTDTYNTGFVLAEIIEGYTPGDQLQLKKGDDLSIKPLRKNGFEPSEFNPTIQAIRGLSARNTRAMSVSVSMSVDFSSGNAQYNASEIMADLKVDALQKLRRPANEIDDLFTKATIKELTLPVLGLIAFAVCTTTSIYISVGPVGGGGIKKREIEKILKSIAFSAPPGTHSALLKLLRISAKDGHQCHSCASVSIEILRTQGVPVFDYSPQVVYRAGVSWAERFLAGVPMLSFLETNITAAFEDQHWAGGSLSVELESGFYRGDTLRFMSVDQQRMFWRRLKARHAGGAGKDYPFPDPTGASHLEGEHGDPIPLFEVYDADDTKEIRVFGTEESLATLTILESAKGKGCSLRLDFHCPEGIAFDPMLMRFFFNCIVFWVGNTERLGTRILVARLQEASHPAGAKIRFEANVVKGPLSYLNSSGFYEPPLYTRGPNKCFPAMQMMLQADGFVGLEPKTGFLKTGSLVFEINSEGNDGKPWCTGETLLLTIDRSVYTVKGEHTIMLGKDQICRVQTSKAKDRISFLFNDKSKCKLKHIMEILRSLAYQAPPPSIGTSPSPWTSNLTPPTTQTMDPLQSPGPQTPKTPRGEPSFLDSTLSGEKPTSARSSRELSSLRMKAVSGGSVSLHLIIEDACPDPMYVPMMINLSAS